MLTLLYANTIRSSTLRVHFMYARHLAQSVLIPNMCAITLAAKYFDELQHVCQSLSNHGICET